MSKLKYMGGIIPSVKSCRFITSVFLNEETREFFIQDDDDDIIDYFTKINTPKNLHTVDTNLYAEEGDAYIYSYSVADGDFLYGSRKEIEPKLVQLVTSTKLNVHAKLIVSSFLNLYGRTLQLAQDSNSDLKRKGIEQEIDIDLFFNNASSFKSGHQNVLEGIQEKFEQFTKLNASIHLDDIAIIKDDKAYFNNHFIEAGSIVKQMLDSSQLTELFSKILELSSSYRTFDVYTLSKDNKVYEFMLGARSLILEQPSIEQGVSQVVMERKIDPNQSILDIGIELDKELYELEAESVIERSLTSRNEEDLMKSFMQIIEGKI